jgi:hypothetical protein
MEEQLEATDWNEFARIASVEFVSEVSPNLVGDAQEVAKLAMTYVSPKVSMLSPDKALQVANDFLANVEKVRRSMVSALRTAENEKEDEDISMESEDKESESDSNLFETIDEIDDMQEDADGEEGTSNKKKSNTEISDEGWLL